MGLPTRRGGGGSSTLKQRIGIELKEWKNIEGNKLLAFVLKFMRMIEKKKLCVVEIGGDKEVDLPKLFYSIECVLGKIVFNIDQL